MLKLKLNKCGFLNKSGDSTPSWSSWGSCGCPTRTGILDYSTEAREIPVVHICVPQMRILSTVSNALGRVIAIARISGGPLAGHKTGKISCLSKQPISQKIWTRLFQGKSVKSHSEIDWDVTKGFCCPQVSPVPPIPPQPSMACFCLLTLGIWGFKKASPGVHSHFIDGVVTSPLRPCGIFNSSLMLLVIRAVNSDWTWVFLSDRWWRISFWIHKRPSLTLPWWTMPKGSD